MTVGPVGALNGSSIGKAIVSDMQASRATRDAREDDPAFQVLLAFHLEKEIER